MGSQSGIDAPARFHSRSSAVSICAGMWPRIQSSWMQCAPATPSPSASERSKAVARSRSDCARSGLCAGGKALTRQRSLEQADDALVFLDVPAVLVVVSRDRNRTYLGAVRLPDTGA